MDSVTPRSAVLESDHDPATIFENEGRSTDNRLIYLRQCSRDRLDFFFSNIPLLRKTAKVST